MVSTQPDAQRRDDAREARAPDDAPDVATSFWSSTKRPAIRSRSSFACEYS